MYYMKHVNFAPVCNTSTLIYEIQYLTAFILCLYSSACFYLLHLLQWCPSEWYRSLSPLWRHWPHQTPRRRTQWRGTPISSAWLVVSWLEPVNRSFSGWSLKRNLGKMMKIQQKIEKQYNIPYPVTFPVYIISSSAFRIYNYFLFLWISNFIMFSVYIFTF